MADHSVSAVLSASSHTGGLGGVHTSASVVMRGGFRASEIRPPQVPQRLPNGEEVVILRPVRR